MTGKPFCPSCGKAATGNFCQQCGAKLGGRFCNQCGAKIAAGATFCNQCGAKAGAGGGGVVPGGAGAAASVFGGQNLPWWIAGAAMFVAILLIGTNMVQQEGPAPLPATAPGGNAATGPSAVDINSMTPIQAADRLFDRVMRSASEGDTATALQFLPMAVGAYERARPLDLHGLFDLAMLQNFGDMSVEALATAEEILQQEPNHILALGSAAQAAIALERSEDAAGYYRRLVAGYDAEVGRALTEYQGHVAVVESMKADAEAFLAGR